MSGGFFRGTSADQDTRFSNKQAKLLKSQKFAPELEHLVDMTKVNMDVIKPWITRRVTELLGFEDEVLINFIHSLLDAKEVNGKEVQIQITGFMEKNTGKFMKELWTLLLSAQKNASGVPQQFLDAKEEELRKKKVENDKITSELQKKREKEGRDLTQERLKKMDGGFDAKDASDPVKPMDSGDYDQDGKGIDKRNGVRSRNRFSRSPHSPAISTSPKRDSPNRSMSKSFSNSRSYSGDRQRSRSISRLPEARGRSISSERIRRSPQGQPISPPRRHSPWQSPRKRSSYSSRRSRSRSRYRSPSLRRRVRSPFRRRSPSPVRRRRSPSPVRRRRSPSPVRRRRSPSPMRRRRSPSPVRRRRSPSPVRRRRSPSPVKRRRSPSPMRSPSPIRKRGSPSPARRLGSPSPVRRRRSPSPVRRHRSSPLVRRHRSPSPLRRRRSPSPMRRRRSPSPMRRMSPIPLRRRSPSPLQSSSPVRRSYRSRTPRRRSPSPVMRRSPVSKHKWSPSPSPKRSFSSGEWSSKSPVRHASPSPVRRNSPRQIRSPVKFSQGRVRTHERLSPAAHRSSSPLRNVKRGQDHDSLHYKSQGSLSISEKSLSRSVSPQARNRTNREDRSPYESPQKQRGEMLTLERSLSPPHKPRNQKPRHDIPETSERAEPPYYGREGRDRKLKSSDKKSKYLSPDKKWKDSPAKILNEDKFSPERAAFHPGSESRGLNDNIDLTKKGREINSDKSSGRVPETPPQQKSPMYKESFSNDLDGKRSNEKNHSHSNHSKGNDQRHKSEGSQYPVGKVDHANQSVSYDSGSEESGKHRREGKDKRKHKRSERKAVASDEEFSYDSELEDRKEAKRRKKEERKLRKEEKRRRREERRRKKEERRAEKLKMKGRTDDYTSDDDEAERMDSRRSDNEETPSDQKKLEIELRNKALESLKAKKGMNN
ncbi:serine/arginine repetitive matrix protein 1 [Senna tora]|uniref:Serine/arginine repetitive matrix protein 1 n=1 Tax=Senna tora TaxID=362788 RepID=A0A834SKQ6_9FABA|nr:serine/arginine repetitive matrix protein 1 [Senna tora]